MSKKEIEPGMLCFLTKCLETENNGKPVVVLQKHVITVHRPEDFLPLGTVTWVVESKSPIMAQTKGKLDWATKIVVLERQLIPIDGDLNGDEDESRAWLPPVPKETSCRTPA